MAANLAPHTIDDATRKKNQEDYKKYLDAQAASRASLKAQTHEASQAHAEHIKASTKAWQESEEQRVAAAAARKAALRESLKVQMEEDRQRKKQAEWDRRGRDASGHQTVKKSEVVSFIEVPRLETLGVMVRQVPVPAAEAMTMNSKDVRFNNLRHMMQTDRYAAIQTQQM